MAKLVKNKPHAKYIFINKIEYKTYAGIQRVSYCIGTLTDDNTYYYDEYWHRINIDHLSPGMINKLTKRFDFVKIDQFTEVVMSNNIQPNEFIRVYFTLIRHYVGFLFSTTDDVYSCKRINAYYHYAKVRDKKRGAQFSHIHKWIVINKLLEYEKIPWLNKQMMEKFDNMSELSRRKRILTGVGVFYMVTKRLIQIYKDRGKQRAAEKKKLEEETIHEEE